MAETTECASSEDEAVFGALFADAYPQLLRFAVRRVGADCAPDVVSEAFLAAWRRRGDIRERDALVAWLYTATRRAIMNADRTRVRQDRLQRKLAAEVPDAEAPDHTDVYVALDRLDYGDRELLRQIVWDGLTVGEAAGLLGISAPTARVRLFRARRRFAEQLRAVEAEQRLEELT